MPIANFHLQLGTFDLWFWLQAAQALLARISYMI